jgi:hypothetical protein
MTILKNRQEYDVERHGNVFGWIVQEAARLRYWQKPVERNPLSKPQLRSLRGVNGGNSGLIHNADKAGLQQPGEHIFEFAGARKL